MKLTPKKIDEIIIQLEQATKTERRLPPVGVKNKFCAWPEVIRSRFEAYSSEGEAHATVNLTSKQISEYNEVILWLQWLDKLSQQIVWAASHGVSWRAIAPFAGCSDKTCKKHYEQAILTIYYELR